MGTCQPLMKEVFNSWEDRIENILNISEKNLLTKNNLKSLVASWHFRRLERCNLLNLASGRIRRVVINPLYFYVKCNCLIALCILDYHIQSLCSLQRYGDTIYLRQNSIWLLSCRENFLIGVFTVGTFAFKGRFLRGYTSEGLGIHASS